MNFQGMGCRKFCGRVSPYGSVGEPGKGVRLQGTVRNSGNGESLFMGALSG